MENRFLSPSLKDDFTYCREHPATVKWLITIVNDLGQRYDQHEIRAKTWVPPVQMPLKEICRRLSNLACDDSVTSEQLIPIGILFCLRLHEMQESNKA